MRTQLVILLSCLLLTGCSGPTTASQPPQPEVQPDDELVTALSLPLAELAPYEPWVSMEPDTVSADTMGEILCEKTMPDGTEVVCYWHPDHLTDPDHQFTKYWAVRRGDALLRFCQEESGYDSSGDYDVTPFSDILGQSGFRIRATRGVTYIAYDYYVLDENGIPRLLADCANGVGEADFNGDGVTELMWFYHGGQEVFYYALLDGRVCFAEVTFALADMSPLYFWADPDFLDISPIAAGAALPVSYYPCGGTPWDETAAYPTLSAQLRFTPEAVEFQVPGSQLWTADRYGLKDGVPCVKRSVETDWTPLGPAVPAPASWADHDLAGRNKMEDWTGVQPSWSAMQMVSAGDGWLVLSLGRGVAGMDTYVYRTRDGGATWTEAAPLPESAWKPFKAAFPDSEHAVIATELFNGAPVYATADGGATWTEAELPLPEEDTVWQPSSLWLDGWELYLYMETTGTDGSYHAALRSADGESWTLEEIY